MNKREFANAISLSMLPNSYARSEYSLSINKQIWTYKNTGEDFFANQNRKLEFIGQQIRQFVPQAILLSP